MNRRLRHQYGHVLSILTIRTQTPLRVLYYPHSLHPSLHLFLLKSLHRLLSQICNNNNNNNMVSQSDSIATHFTTMATGRDLESYEPNSSILSVPEATMEDSGSQTEPTKPRVLENTTATTTTNQDLVPSVQNLPISEVNSARKRSNQNCRVTAATPASMATTDQDLERKEQNLSTSEDITGRERLRRHRMEMAGKVRIPEIWGQERLLKDWVDCSAIDRCLVPKGVVSARKALVEECRRANSAGLRIENWC